MNRIESEILNLVNLDFKIFTGRKLKIALVGPSSPSSSSGGKIGKLKEYHFNNTWLQLLNKSNFSYYKTVFLLESPKKLRWVLAIHHHHLPLSPFLYPIKFALHPPLFENITNHHQTISSSTPLLNYRIPICENQLISLWLIHHLQQFYQ